jgi:hypothetical protein
MQHNIQKANDACIRKAIIFYLDDRKDLCIRKKYEMKNSVDKKNVIIIITGEKKRRKDS